MRLILDGILLDPTRPDLRRLAERNCVGSFVDARGEARATSVGALLPGLQEAGLFAMPTSPRMMEHNLGYPFRIAPDASSVVVRKGRGKRKRRVGPAQRVDEIRTRLDFVLRAHTAPAMRENLAAIDGQFVAEFGGTILPG